MSVMTYPLEPDPEHGIGCFLVLTILCWIALLSGVALAAWFVARAWLRP